MVKNLANPRVAVKAVAVVLFVSAVLGAGVFLLFESPLSAALVTLVPPLAVAYTAAVENTFSGGDYE